MTKIKKLILLASGAVLIIILTPLFGAIYKDFLGPACTGFLCPSHPEYIPGFFISYALFVSIFSMLFGGVKKYKYFFLLMGILLFFDAFLGAWEDLIIDVGVAVIGWLLGQLGLIIYKNVKKNV